MSELDLVTIGSADGALQASFAPAAGMVCWSLRHRGVELLAQREGLRAYAERGATMGVPLLYPWANRLAHFGYEAAGRAVTLDPDSPLLAREQNGLPIHGVKPSYQQWTASEATDRAALRAILRWNGPDLIEIFPFPHELEYAARIDDRSLTITVTVHASAGVAVPVSFGFHPYLTLRGAPRAEWVVSLPVDERLLLDRYMIPTSEREAVSFSPFALADSGWDDGFAGVAGSAAFSASARGSTIEIEFLEGYPYSQVYSPPGSDFVCFEPMTAPTNALVSGWDLPVLPAGERYRAAFRIALAH